MYTVELFIIIFVNIEEPILIEGTMSTQRKNQISCLNDASEKIVKSHECLEQEVEKLSTDDRPKHQRNKK